MLDKEFVAMLACPEDRGPLLYFADEPCLYNPRLRRRYEIQDDIPIMLVEEGVAADETEHVRLMAKAEADGVEPNFDPAEE